MRTVGADRVALVATAVAVVFVPFVHPTGPANTAAADIFVLLAMATVALWSTSGNCRWRFPLGIPVALFMAAGAVGALIGPVPGAGLEAIAQDAYLLIWFWVLVNVARTPANLRILTATWVYSSIGWVMLLYVGLATGSHAITGQTANQGVRVQLTLGDPSYAANYFFISLMLMWATGRPRRVPIRVAAYAALVIGIVLTGSNSGLMALAVGLVVGIVLGVRRRRGGVAALVAFLLITFAGAIAVSTVSLKGIEDRASTSKYAFIRDGLGRGTSVEQRGMLLHESIVLYRRGNPLGEGPVSTKPRLRSELAPFEKEAHDDYAAALLERGPVGLISLLAIVSILLTCAFRVAASPVRRGFDAAIAHPNALAGALAGTLAAGGVYELLHVRHVWALFAFVAALYLWSRE
ncbi:MAG TPA: O-antigen ligase family protein [Gaiellaceae bacterium]